MNNFLKKKFKETNTIDSYINSFEVDKYLFIYEIKIISSYIKSLYLSNFINFEEKKKFLNSLILIKKNFKYKNIENIHNYIKNELIRYNGTKILFLNNFNKNEQFNILNKVMLLDEIEKINIQIIFLRKTIISIAEKEFNTLIPSFKNSDIDKPITLGHYLLSWNEMFKRDHINLLNCKKITNFCSFDNEILFKNNYKINKNVIKKLLNFKNINENLIDSISDRDYIVLFSQFCNILIIHLSRICEDIIYWSNKQYKFIDFINKNKKNFYIFEIIRSKTGRVLGNSINIVTVLKAQSIFNNKDNLEDKESYFDNIYTIKKSLYYFNQCLLTLKFNKKNFYISSLKNYSTNSSIIYYLIKKGESIENANITVNNCINYCNNKKINFFNISLKELKKINLLFENDIFYFLSIESTIKMKTIYGSTSPNQVLKSIQRSKFFLNNIILKFK